MDRERTIAAYDQMAARYAARPFYPLEREIGRFVALVGRGGLVLDVGSGPGQYARELAKRGLRVVALDLSAGMLAQARLAMTPRPLQADMRYLPFSTGVADGCFVCASLLHLPRPYAIQALAAFRRVLRHGGVLYLGLKEGVGEEWVPEGTGSRRFVYYQPAEVDQLLVTAGFRVTDGWVGPPGPGQHHRWINRFGIAH